MFLPYARGEKKDRHNLLTSEREFCKLSLFQSFARGRYYCDVCGVRFCEGKSLSIANRSVSKELESMKFRSNLCDIDILIAAHTKVKGP
jgi:uncharacterized Zn finger protein (UPF0148 family)